MEDRGHSTAAADYRSVSDPLSLVPSMHFPKQLGRRLPAH